MSVNKIGEIRLETADAASHIHKGYYSLLEQSIDQTNISINKIIGLHY